MGANAQLAEHLRQTAAPLPERQVREVEAGVLSALGALDPLLAHIVAVKLVRNERRNFVNIRIRKPLVPLVHAQTLPSGTRYFFCVSLYLEPFVTVTAIHPERGPRETWGAVDRSELEAAVEGFKRKHGVHRETYRYDDGRGEADELRQVLQAMERRQGAPFSLAIRVATQMFTALMPMVRLLLKPGPLREAIAVVAGTEPREVFDSLTAIEPALAHLMQRGRGGGYPELRLQFLSTIFAVEKRGVIYEAHLSDKFEPFAIIIAIDRAAGKIIRLSRDQVEDLEAALGELRRKFGIAQESYHYTPYKERMATDAFVAGGGASTASKAHSSDFHLKMRIGTRMYTDQLKVFRSFDFKQVCEKVEPVAYNVSRETLPWPTIKQTLLEEAGSV